MTFQICQIVNLYFVKECLKFISQSINHDPIRLKTF